MNKIKTGLLAGLFTLMSAGASAGAIISDGNVKLGINDEGHLNFGTDVADVAGTTVPGLRYLPPGSGDEFESTSHGCLCEGWGVGNVDTGTAGYANVDVDGGAVGLALVSFASTATTATSVVDMAGELKVTHDFALAAETDNLFRVTVSIENTSGADISDVKYRRSMDWDTSPTPFSEFVTIGGTAMASAVDFATDDGFCTSNPLGFDPCDPIVAGATGDFTDSGPSDHGAQFTFGFGPLADGDTLTFEIFYGGALGEAEALASLAAVGAEVFSLGWSATDVDQDGVADDGSGALTPTFIFGFAGVGGVVVTVPEPATLSILALGLLGMLRLRRK